MANELIEGAEYKVFSSRKGKFKIRLIRFDETWATGVVISGKADAILKENEVTVGEEVTLRRELTSFTPTKNKNLDKTKTASDRLTR